jgi:tripartite-type tricarboxylate transporter receptor subunit TctC
MRCFEFLGATALLFAGPTALWAQAYPAKSVRVIVPYAASSTPDIMARLMGQKLSETWGQQVIVENIVGANGIIATETLLKAPRDGYTVAMIAANHVVSPHLYPKLSFDVVKDFAPISALSAVTFILVAHPSLPAKNIRELIALAKAKPGELTFGSAGSGSPGHLAGQLLKSSAGIDLIHVPYKGIAQSLVDTVGGQITMSMSPSAAAMPHVRSQRLRPLGVTSRTRSVAAPEVPTIAESGLPGFELTAWVGLVGAAGVPREVVMRLNGEFNRVLALPDVKSKLEGQGVDLLGTTPERFVEMITTDAVKYAKLVKESGAKLD